MCPRPPASRRRALLATMLAAAASLCLATPTQAADSPLQFPTHPIHLVVPFSAGGGTDILARLFAKSISQTLGQPVVVDNIAGAGGIIGAQQVARAAADGYTLMFGTPGTVQINPAIKPVQYDPYKDFTPISQFSDSPMVLVVNGQTPWKSVPELIEAARAKPGSINYGSAGIGSISHLSAEMFEFLADVKMTHVPYRGTSQAITDLRAGVLQLEIENMPAVLELIKAGQVRALAVGADQRSPFLPDLPTMEQAGVPGYRSTSWTGLFAPAGTPPAVMERLELAAVAAARDPDILKALQELGTQAIGSRSAAFRSMLESSQPLIDKTVKAAGLATD
ncbi:tripartite tricarboxylate transporter substrate binding protein [Bordetella sp. BOR01]|uniref:Bug family tripartite tricarboxylate transporter substrate binding protein n=1 Tax=Bordetella sp. BOR01 TaxID=2854779 RepID=UPI001C45F1E1|nr:tripartite tricarboxylate transporter substrate binding protein [Bordetella sp. BOR01]MBV7483379.1 tripartite tricarboxylate transporter substrate binding protein [Bordetella sp. BOR01]